MIISELLEAYAPKEPTFTIPVDDKIRFTFRHFKDSEDLSVLTRKQKELIKLKKGAHHPSYRDKVPEDPAVFGQVILLSYLSVDAPNIKDWLDVANNVPLIFQSIYSNVLLKLTERNEELFEEEVEAEKKD